MQALAKARLVVGIVCILSILAAIGTTACHAEEAVIESGDPGNISPGMSTLEPTPDILCGFITVLVTVVSLVLS